MPPPRLWIVQSIESPIPANELKPGVMVSLDEDEIQVEISEEVETAEIQFDEIDSVRELVVSVNALLKKEGLETNKKDASGKSSDTEAMTNITREEFSSTLSAVEGRMDQRIDRMEKESERSGAEFRREMLLRDKALHREMSLKEKAFRREHQAYAKALDEKLGGIESSVSSAINEIKGFKLWMAGIGIAVVLGIMGANATIFGGGKAFFDGGRDSVQNQQRVEALIQESKSQTEATKKILEEIQSRQAAQQLSPPNAAPTSPNK